MREPTGGEERVDEQKRVPDGGRHAGRRRVVSRRRVAWFVGVPGRELARGDGGDAQVAVTATWAWDTSHVTDMSALASYRSFRAFVRSSSLRGRIHR